MTSFFHKLSTRLLIDISIAAVISTIIAIAANFALTGFFTYYAEQPDVFKRLADKHFENLQEFVLENELVSTDGKAFTEWNSKYPYVSLMVIRQNEALCYNSFVSYDMTYTEKDKETFYWGTRNLPVYEYRLQLADEKCKVYFSGYFDQAYTPLRRTTCSVLFVISFALSFFFLFKKYIKYIGEMEHAVDSICNKNFSKQIAIHDSTELSSLASKINHLSDTIQLLLMTDNAKIKQKEQFVKSIAHDIRTPLTAVIGYLEILSKGCISNKEDAPIFISRTLEKANHIRMLTDDLFAFKESNKELICEEYDGQEILTLMSSSIANYLKSNNYSLCYTNSIARPFKMQTNVTMIMRLIDNICSNIFKHSAREKVVSLHAYLNEKFLVIEEQNYIRKKPVKNSASDEEGFGLMICDEIMKSLGGTMMHTEANEQFVLTLRFPVLA